MKKFFFATISAAAILVGCTNETDVETPVTINKRNVTIQADINCTKTTVTDEGVYSWSANETIGVVEQDGSDVIPFSIENAEEGLFSGTLTAEKDPVFAVSPAAFVSNVVEVGGDIEYDITLDNIDDYVPGTTNAIMVAEYSGKDGDNYKFHFNHAAALVKVRVENVPVGTAKAKLTLDKNITGIWVGLDTTTPILGEDTNLGEPSLTLTLKDAFTKYNKSADFYFPVPCNTYSSFQFELLNATGERLMGKKKTGLNIELGVADLFLAPTITLAPVDYAALETSNVTLSKGDAPNVYEVTMNEKDALKAGTTKAYGAVQITVPAYTTVLHLHAAAWNNETVVLGITGATADPNELSLTANSGISGSGSSFSLSDDDDQSKDPADYYFSVELTGITKATTLTFTATSGTSGKRFVIWGVNADDVVDSREAAGMSWSEESATATYTTVNDANSLAFTAPTLTVGNATGITYQSTDETIATISNAGVVTINLTDNAVKEGSTTIKAIFAGDTNYMPQTVSYTLTVVDSRTVATTPTFSPAAGEVTANQIVTFNPSDQGLTFHYTLDGSDPTVASPTAASVTIDAAKTVKVLATKTGYKPSAIASAAYTIEGAAEELPFSESFESSIGSFTIKTESNPDNLTSIWGHTGSYMKATSYNGSNHDAESWLISPNLQLPTLSTGEVIRLKFSQCINKYFGTIGDEATLWVKAGSNDWAKITITYPTLGNNTWSSFEEQVVDLSSYAGQKIKVAFKYIGKNATAGTWEVKDVSVKKYSSYAVTWSAPSNGSIVVKHGETTLTSGNTVLEGETVTITASPADGYALSALVYNDGEDHDIKSAKSFTMPAHAVTISASFTSTGGSGGSLTSGSSYSYTIESKIFSANGSTTLGGMTWALDTDTQYFAYDNNIGFHLGSSSKPISYANFTLGYASYCNSETAKLVNTVKVTIKGNGTSPKVKVLVGGESIGEETIDNTMTEYTYTATGEKFGDVEIQCSYSSSAKKNFIIQKVEIN